MRRVLVTPRSFCQEAERLLRDFEIVRNPYGRIMTEREMLAAAPDIDALIVGVDRVSRAFLGAAPRLRVISKYGVGTDNIDLDYASERGIIVSVTQGANTEAVADYAFTLMLSVARRVIEADTRVRNGDYAKLQSVDVFGKTLGIVGFGAIGRAVAKRARGFDMRILAFDAYVDKTQHDVEYVDLDTLCQSSDFISLHAPLNHLTRGIIGERELGMMKDSVIVINTARGGLIDEGALYDALSQNKIFGAGIDVFDREPPGDSPLLNLPNIIVSAHNAASTEGAVRNMSMMAAKNVIEACEYDG